MATARVMAMSLVGLCIGHPSVGAFEYQGIRSGMTLAETSEAAASLGEKLETISKPAGLYLVGDTISLTFCADELMLLTEHAPGKLEEFVERYIALSAEHGPAQQSGVHEVMDHPAIVHIYATFLLPDGEKRELLLGSDHGRTHVTLTHHSALACTSTGLQ